VAKIKRLKQLEVKLASEASRLSPKHPSLRALKKEIAILKQDVDKYLKADDELIKLEQKVTYIQSVVDYLDKTIRIISNRTFQIKNAIEWKKFTSGII